MKADNALAAADSQLSSESESESEWIEAIVHAATTYTNLLAAPDSQQSSESESEWIDAVVDASTTYTNLLTKNACGLCPLYTDMQVEFETHIETSYSTSAVGRLLRRTATEASMDGKLYRYLQANSSGGFDGSGALQSIPL